jgi:hypothetical protein
VHVGRGSDARVHEGIDAVDDELGAAEPQHRGGAAREAALCGGWKGYYREEEREEHRDSLVSAVVTVLGW